jgi:hypothetical protein
MNTNEHQQPRPVIACDIKVRTEDGKFHHYSGLFPNTCEASLDAAERFGVWSKIDVTPMGYSEVRR